MSYTGADSPLRPCPACGRYHPAIDEAPIGLGMERTYWVHCTGCGFRSKMSNSRQGAIFYWNNTIIGALTSDPHQDDGAQMQEPMKKTVDLMCVAEDAIISYRERWTRYANTHHGDADQVWRGYVSEVENLLNQLTTIQRGFAHDD